MVKWEKFAIWSLIELLETLLGFPLTGEPQDDDGSSVRMLLRLAADHQAAKTRAEEAKQRGDAKAEKEANEEAKKLKRMITTLDEKID